VGSEGRIRSISVDKKSLKAYRDADWLRQKYCEEGLSIHSMACLAKVDNWTIHRWMVRFAIPRRAPGEAWQGRKHSLESRRKMSEATRGKKHHAWGKKLSPEQRRKISEALRGEKHPRWKGGRTHHARGYIWILRPDHPYADANSHILEHRLVMEEHLGRFLKPEEVVHHINEDVSDNRRENLMLFPSNAEHTKFHRRMRKSALNRDGDESDDAA